MQNATERVPDALSSSVTDIESRVMRKVIRRLVPLMVLLFVINFLDRVNVGYAALTMSKDIGLGPAVFGFGVGLFSIGYIIFEIPSNLLLHRVGAHIWIARIMVTWGIVSMGMAFVTGPTSFYIARFLLGVAEAGFMPGMTLYLSYWIPNRHRARVNALWFIGMPIAIVAAGPLSGLLLQYFNGVWGIRGWQWIFIVEGMPALLVAVVTYIYLTPCPERANWLTHAEKSWLKSALADDHQKRAAQFGEILSAKAALLNPRVWFLGFLYIGMNIILSSVNAWLPTIIKSWGSVNVFEASALTAIPWFFAGICAFIWARFADRSREYYKNVTWPLVFCSLGLLASAFATSPVVSLACLTVAVIGIMTAYTVFWVLPGALLSGAAAAGGIALINTLGNLGGFVGPSVLGAIKQATGSFYGGLLFMGAAAACSAILILFARPSIRKQIVTSHVR